MHSKFAALAAGLLVVAGCVFSSDDDTPPPAIDAWQPELYVTPDSICASFPVDWSDTTTWTWNGRYEGAWQYVIETSFETIGPTTRPRAMHMGFVVRSDGSGARTGTLGELAQQGEGFVWFTDAYTGRLLYSARQWADVRITESSIDLRAWRGLTDYVYGSVPDRGPWMATFEQYGGFESRTVRRSARYVYDISQDRARALSGPLAADDYAIMDVVARNYRKSIIGDAAVIVSPTHTYTHSNEDNNMQVLRAGSDTETAFTSMRTRAIDVHALSRIGYTVVDEHAIPPGEYMRFSAIGYNRERSQAMLYGSYHCGMLCAEGEIILLRKIRGYWVIENRVMLWIS